MATRNLLYLILILLSVHACDARCFGIDLFCKETRTQKAGYERVHGAIIKTTIKNESFDTFLRGRNQKGEISALMPSETKEIVSTHEDLRQPTVFQEYVKREERSMLGKATDDRKEAVKSEESEGAAEDVVVMDYAQPHRKPPIHNEKN